MIAAAKFVKKAFYKNNAPAVYLSVLSTLPRKCAKIYNACRTIVRLIKPIALRHFRLRWALYHQVLAVVVYKKSRCRHISFLEVIEKFQVNKAVRLVVFHTGKIFTIRPWKSPEIHTGISEFDCFLEGAECSHPDRYSGRNPSSCSILANELKVIVNPDISPILHFHERLINAKR